MHLHSRCSSCAGAVSFPALVVARLDASGRETEDIGVGQESAGAGLQSIHVVSSIVVGPGEARSIASIIHIGGTQLGAVLPGIHQALKTDGLILGAWELWKILWDKEQILQES